MFPPEARGWDGPDPARHFPLFTMKAIHSTDWARIKLFAMDVDGVLTDGTVTVFSNGIEGKSFSILDGLGLRRLLMAGVTVAWISGRPSEATAVRASELEIPHVVQGSRDKREVLEEIARLVGCEAGEVCYMGDDVVDLTALAWAGIAVSLPNATADALAAADFVTRHTGGKGAVREICDLILKARNS
jgi:3-deoxy-D-manno-octulosonate 8-phosphate phosphatase (KDO 8-P phosphatase)